MKKTLLFGVVLLITVFSWQAFSGQETADPERMDTSAFESTRRPASVFSHDEHNEVAELEDDCAVCHHVYEDGKLVEDESSEDSTCAECHGLAPGPDNDISLEVAYHRRCWDCHFDTGKGPVLCGECHIKE